MNDRELKELWQGQPLRDPSLSPAQVISAMHSKTARLRRVVDARDVRELCVCAVVLIIFGIFFFTVYREPIPRVGDLIILGSTIFIAWKLIHTRRMTPPAPSGATIVESLRAELNAVRAQSRLLGSVLWWYLIPLTIGMLVATWGLPIDLHGKIVSTLVFLGVDGLLYWSNQWARSKQLLPVEAQLESLLHSAETGDALEQAQVAALRPIALSMSAGDQVKPVEFKVAFWQLALYGEIGFVGIWFFGMLAWTEFNVRRIFIPQHLLWIVPCFLAGLLYSWLLQKLTVRAVGISTLGVHLHRGQVLILWDEIKEVRPLRILNIQSLWLIRQSGEKMIMPWTSLDRPGDLKAAVDAFAPANNPLRKHLSLLRRT
jgi:hypothetical protein